VNNARPADLEQVHVVRFGINYKFGDDRSYAPCESYYRPSTCTREAMQHVKSSFLLMTQIQTIRAPYSAAPLTTGETQRFQSRRLLAFRQGQLPSCQQALSDGKCNTGL